MRQKHFCRLTGATARQVDVWYKAGMDMCYEKVEGSGNHRWYKESAVPAVALVVKVQDVCSHSGFPVHTLVEIFNNYYQGYIDFDGFSMLWKVDYGPHAPSRGGSGPT